MTMNNLIENRNKRIALLSVSDKKGLIPLATVLIAQNYSLVASGGTARAIKEAGLEVRAVEDITHAKVLIFYLHY
jgi:phosphoribosylaminoimidazolecarboxamide formyltransferase/IMP cyclohydrolase